MHDPAAAAPDRGRGIAEGAAYLGDTTQEVSVDTALPAPPLTLPAVPVAAIGRAALGYLLLPAVGFATLGPDLPGAVLSAAAVPAGSLLLTLPALLVVHEVMGLSTPPSALLGAVGRAFVGAGEVALGLAPALLLFAATTGDAPWLFVTGLAALGATFLLLAVRALDRLHAEAAAGTRARMFLLARGWALLALLVGGRLWVDVAALA